MINKIKGMDNMRLEIKNIGRIEEASIEMNGITVIAGENDTGKSTVGKVLYALFSSLYNCESKIDRYIKFTVYRELESLIRYNYNVPITLERRIKDVGKKLIEDSFIKETSLEYISDVIRKEVFIRNDIEVNEELIYDCSKKVMQLINADREKIKRKIVQECFNKEFCFQTNNLNKKNDIGEITLSVKNKDISVEFINNSIEKFKQDINLLYDATYLDAPMVIADLDHPFIQRNIVCNHRQDIVIKFLNKNHDISIVDEAIADERLDKVMSSLNKVVKEKVISDRRKIVINVEGVEEPVNIQNLSSGMKSFAILKTIILNGYIKDRSVLILDEPEIHLHPKWQIILADVIIQLQKEYEITCVINTHSPYFLNAIEVFAEKEKISDRCKYYLAEKSGITDVSFSIDRIYELLSDAFDTLDEIQGEE